MKILLIWPYGYETKIVVPLVFSYLIKELDQQKNKIELFDCSLNNLPHSSPEFSKKVLDFKPDLIAFSCWTHVYQEVSASVSLIKKLLPDCKIIIGGVHATLYPDHLMENPNVDFLIRGEAEFTFSKFITELNQTSPKFDQVPGLVFRKSDTDLQKNNYQLTQNLDEIKFPDYHFIHFEKYLKQGYRLLSKEKLNAPLWLTRGCPYTCSFCSAHQMNGPIVRSHSISYSMELIKKLKSEFDIKLFNIVDDNFTQDIDHAKNFCRTLISEKINLKFGIPRGIRMESSDQELFNLMHQAGWENIVIAPESGSKVVLDHMNKSFKPELTFPIIEQIRKAKLKVYANFMIGFPSETEKDIELTIKMIRKVNPDFFRLSIFQPLPGTPIHTELVNKNEIDPHLLPQDYSKGLSAYKPAELENVNFSKVILREYLYMFIRKPSTFIELFQMYSLKFLLERSLANAFQILKAKLSFTKTA